jgi:hypothetical protein
MSKEIRQYNTLVKLDIEWNISDFICKEEFAIPSKINMNVLGLVWALQ